ncbi:MAG TPA: SpoIIE family protein phosphatase [Roseiflexaceae bacterium]|nr:SpoIIE family protein phosphatase [Roseiflexaceae bacterium]
MRRLLTRSWNALRSQSGLGAQVARISIADRLRWSYLISSTLPLLIVGAVLLRINATAQEHSVYSDQKNTANALTRSIASYVSDIRQQLRAYMLVVRPGITGRDQWQSDAIGLQIRNYPKIIAISIINPDGQQLMEVRNQQPTPDNKLRNLGAMPSVKQALAGKSSYSDITENQDSARTFTMTLPLPNDAGAIIGAVQAEVRADAIIQELKATAMNSGTHAYIVWQDTGDVLFDDGASGMLPTANLDQLLQAEEGTAEYMGARNENVIGAIAPVEISPDGEPTGWAVVAERSSAAAFAGIRSSLPVLALLIVLVGLLALLWAFRQARAFLRPLKELRDGAMAFGEGHLDHRIAAIRDDELGDVARTFNTMAAHLQQSLAEIEHQNERLLEGLALARDIQTSLLPIQAPWPSGTIDICARSIPAYEVGGDFYTYVALPRNCAAITIGDISGKGVGAALMMALTASTIESQMHQCSSPAEVLTMLNATLLPRLKTNRMNAALLCAVVDPQQSTVRIANAGMIAPMLISPRGSELLDVGGLPVGAYAAAKYHEVHTTLPPDHTLLLVSDGVVEAHNSASELFGFDRLEAAIAEVPATEDLRVLVQHIVNRVQLFMGNYEQHDDITVVAFRSMVTASQNARLQDEEQTSTYATV